MDCDIALGESLIIVPHTYVKSPGSPFLDNLSRQKKYFTFTGLPTPSLSSLLEEFKAKFEAKFKSLDEFNLKGADDTSFLSESSSNLGWMVKQYSSFDSPNRPGEMKKSSDDDAELIQLSQKILSFFEISLVSKTGSSASRKLYGTLKFLIPEICLFPVEFFKKLQINQLVFCEEDVSDQQSPSTKATSFSLAAVDTQLKVIERLYQIIFIHLLRRNPRKEQECFSGILDYEKAFIALMKNSNNFHLKSKMEELRKWIGQQYPELTEEWFKNRTLEKKKLARVSFVCKNK